MAQPIVADGADLVADTRDERISVDPDRGQK
jgi:hypothetical protein